MLGKYQRVLFCASSPDVLDGNDYGTHCSRKQIILTFVEMIRKAFQDYFKKGMAIKERHGDQFCIQQRQLGIYSQRTG